MRTNDRTPASWRQGGKGGAVVSARMSEKRLQPGWKKATDGHVKNNGTNRGLVRLARRLPFPYLFPLCSPKNEIFRTLQGVETNVTVQQVREVG